MIEALQEEKKLTLKLYTNVSKVSFYDYYDDKKPEGQIQNVIELDNLLEKNKDANLIDIYIFIHVCTKINLMYFVIFK